MANTIDVVMRDYLDSRAQEFQMNFHGFNANLEESIECGDYPEIDSDNELQLTAIMEQFLYNAYKAIWGSKFPYQKDPGNEELKKIKGELGVKVYMEANEAVVAVSDNGCGIPEENYDKVFKRDFSSFGTKGIGLDIVLDRARKISADISFESEVGKGTTFYIRMGK